MNPYYQPQNNSPYGQNPSYPHQTGPSRYPALTPLQNPQYNGYSTHARPAGYQPPAQYGNFQVGNSKNEERQALVMKMADLDQGFNTCFLNFYKVWLWIVAVLCTIAFMSIIVSYARNISALSYDVVISFLLMIWNATQSMFGLKAISQKSLKKANAACWMMTLVLVPWLFTEYHLVDVVANWDPLAPEQVKELFEFAIGLVAVLILIHVGLSMNGAFKVRKLLIEKGVLQEKLDDIDYPFRA